MFKIGQRVFADEIYKAGWEIDSCHEADRSTTWVSPDGTQTATIYVNRPYDVEIERA